MKKVILSCIWYKELTELKADTNKGFDRLETTIGDLRAYTEKNVDRIHARLDRIDTRLDRLEQNLLEYVIKDHSDGSQPE